MCMPSGVPKYDIFSPTPLSSQEELNLKWGMIKSWQRKQRGRSQLHTYLQSSILTKESVLLKICILGSHSVRPQVFIKHLEQFYARPCKECEETMFSAVNAKIFDLYCPFCPQSPCGICLKSGNTYALTDKFYHRLYFSHESILNPRVISKVLFE